MSVGLAKEQVGSCHGRLCWDPGVLSAREIQDAWNVGLAFTATGGCLRLSALVSGSRLQLARPRPNAIAVRSYLADRARESRVYFALVIPGERGGVDDCERKAMPLSTALVGRRGENGRSCHWTIARARVL